MKRTKKNQLKRNRGWFARNKNGLCATFIILCFMCAESIENLPL